jgi:xanthine dehydrogenase accessory factor
VYIDPFLSGGDAAFLETVAASIGRRDAVIAAIDLAGSSRTLLRPSDLAAEVARGLLDRQVADRLTAGDSRRVVQGSRDVFYKTFAPPARIVIVGATHIAQILAELAKLAGYGVVVIDPRDGYAATGRFAGVALLADWPKAALDTVGLDAFTAVVALAHVAHLDDEALIAALNSPCVYVGALGSRKNHDKRCARLKAHGLPDAAIARIRAPIGLDIGALTPAEIAVAILADIIASVRGKLVV